MSASLDPKRGFQTLRSTSPSLELISAQLEQRKSEKVMRSKQQTLISRMEKVLDEYAECLKSERK